MIEDPNDPTDPVPPEEGTLDDPLATTENTARKPDDAKVPGDKLPERPDDSEGEPPAGVAPEGGHAL